jgi:hypothetical protein
MCQIDGEGMRHRFNQCFHRVMVTYMCEVFSNPKNPRSPHRVKLTAGRDKDARGNHRTPRSGNILQGGGAELVRYSSSDFSPNFPNNIYISAKRHICSALFCMLAICPYAIVTIWQSARHRINQRFQRYIVYRHTTGLAIMNSSFVMVFRGSLV